MPIKEFTINDFHIGDDPIVGTVWFLEQSVIPQLNMCRNLYISTNDSRWLEEISRILPRSYKWRDLFGED